ncbi:MAG: hypothetical protein IKF99_01025 [Oscillospiraceae bacterium]|nr:hypothetical protein [Oscillospiraceae bacterium]
MEMVSMLQIIMTIVCSCLASSGLWALIQRYLDRKDARTQMIIGLGHDRIVWLGLKYIERGYITQDEYENLFKWLYEPYEKMGGNGSAKRIMDEVRKLPLKRGVGEE